MACGFCESSHSGSVGTLFVDWVAKPLKSQVDYVRHFPDNVEKLTKKKDELIGAQERLQHEVEVESRQLHEIEADVKSSQSKADKVRTDLESLENEIGKNKRCFNWCPDWWWRYRLSKKLEKRVLPGVSELINEMAAFGQTKRVGYRSANAVSTIEFLSCKDFMVSKSSNSAFKQIIEGLKDVNVSMIGLWGMGGVGKTTLAHEVGSQAKKLNLFDKVVIATVSQKPDFEAIQDAIARDLDMKTQEGRRSPQDLWLRMKKEKSILVILDDVWEQIDLKQKIGIPVGEDYKGYKILLITRRRQVCETMDCRMAVRLDCLDDGEAWNLFEIKAGLNNSSDAAIKKVATKVYKKCKGLPVALVALGSALKGKTAYEWKAAWQRLKDRILKNIEDMDETVYLCLEVSFDYLSDMGTKISFLLCSLFPEDYEIYVEDLVRFAWGLEFYGRRDSIKKVRNDGSVINFSAMQCFSNFINDCNLMDLPLKGARFTWGRMSETPSYSRLDRFLIHAEVLMRYPDILQTVKPRSLSDHNPVVLESITINWGPKPFKIFNHWYEKDGFNSFLKHKWDELKNNSDGNEEDLHGLLKRLKNEIKRWVGDNSGDDKENIEKLEREIHFKEQRWQGSAVSQEQEMEITNLRSTLWRAYRAEERAWLQKSRIQWLSVGDRNTKFFHTVASSRRRRNFIHELHHRGRFHRSQ